MFRKKSVIIEWAISYALVLAVPLISIFINYTVNVRTIRREIDQAYQLILNNYADNIDQIMEKEKEVFSWFYFDTAFLELAYSEEADDQFYYDAYKFLTQFSRYESINDVSYWLYFEDKDYIVCSDGANFSQNIYGGRKYLSSEFYDYEEWMSFLKDDYANEYIIYDGLYLNKPGKHLVYANTWSYYGDKRVNIFVAIPIAKVEELTQSLPLGSYLTVIIDNKQQEIEKKSIVLNSERLTELPSDVDIASVAEGQGTYEIGDYKCISMVSGNGKLKYSLLVTRESYWKEARYVRNIHLISLLSSMLIGIGLVVFLLRKNFRPVSRLLLKMGDNGHADNEFNKIEAFYETMSHEHSTMRKTIQNQEKVLQGSYLLSYLKGRKVSDLPFQSGMYALIGFFVPQNEEDTIEEDELKFFIVNNIFCELMKKEKYYRVEDARFLFYLCCLSTDDIEKWKKECFEKMNYLCEFLDEKLGLSIMSAISTVEQDFDQAKFMYQNVMSALEYKRMIGGDGVVLVEELEELGFDENKLFRDCHILIVQALKNGNMNQAYQASQRLFAGIEQMPFIAQRLHVLEAFQTVVDCYNSDIVDAVKRMQLLSKLEDILNADELTIRKRFEEILDFACAKLSGQWKKEDKGIAELIKEYIEANYVDSNLNLCMIAEAMDRNPRYISKIFKDETGEGILDYVNILRIRKAQEILLTRNISIEELTETVGYASTRTFRRYFSKITGTTPIAYLEKKLQKEGGRVWN